MTRKEKRQAIEREMAATIASLNRLAKYVASRGFYSMAADMDETASHMEYVKNNLDQNRTRTVTVPGGYEEEDD